MMSKVQPIDTNMFSETSGDASKPQTATKSRLKRLFERPFHGMLRNMSSERLADQFEPSSVCLDKMVRNFIEDAGDRTSRSGRCNCFSINDSSSDVDDDFVDFSIASADAMETIKGLVVCTTLMERNVLADASAIVEKSKHCKRKDELRKAVADGLRSLGYDASICKSKWERAGSIPSGVYEFIDVMVGGDEERIIVDIDFKSEFEVARPTKSYRAVLQSLPCIFVGQADRLSQIISAVCGAARLSLKKKDLHVPPWRKPEYMRAKWLAPFARSVPAQTSRESCNEADGKKLDDEAAPTALVEPKPRFNGAKVVTGFALF